MLDAVERFLSTARPCLLLVHPDASRLEDAADELLAVCDWPHVSVGRELSAELLSIPSRRRSRVANQWLKTRLSGLGTGPVLCTEIDLLFDPTFDLDPLRLLCHVSRVMRLVVTWPGTHRSGVLAYAVSEHSHYRIWRRPTTEILTLE